MISLEKDTIQLDSLSLVPGSFGIEGLDSSNYTIDPWAAQLILKGERLDSATISYRVFPLKIWPTIISGRIRR